MVLDAKRDSIDPLLRWFAKHLLFISADGITWLALFFSICAGFLFYLSNPDNENYSTYLLLASLFVFLNGLFDALDGKIAKITKTTSRRGDFLDHALDRYADVFIVGGISFSPWCDLRIGFIALVGILLTSYMGTQAQAVGFKRIYAGLLGRADRLALLIFAPIIQYILIKIFNINLIYGFYLLELVMIYIAIIGNITAIQRFYHTLRYFNKNKKDMLKD